MLFASLVACSDYTIDAPPEKSDPEPDWGDDTAQDTDSGSVDSGTDDSGHDDLPAEETCNGTDDDGDGQVDEGFDANGNGEPDCTEEEVYCTPFDDFSGWSYSGTGNWHIEEGLLTEGRNGGYEGIAWVHDLGIADRFYIQVDVAWTNDANDLTGIAWGVQDEAAWVARWDDPQGYYGRHDPIGSMDVSWCDDGCTPYVTDSYGALYWPADKSFVTWTVAVDGSRVDVVVDGASVLTADIPEIAGKGPGVVGLYSNDNDGQVWFDNFCVWVAE